jgi:O-antigen/teichoic acid export membrane protein
MRNNIIKFIVIMTGFIGFGLLIFNHFWKEDQGGWIPVMGSTLILAQLLFVMYWKRPKKSEKPMKDKKGKIRLMLAATSLFLFGFVTVDYFLTGGFTDYNAGVLSVTFIFTLILLFHAKRPQELSEE